MFLKKFKKQKHQKHQNNEVHKEVDKTSSTKFVSMEDVIEDGNFIVPHILVSGAAGTGTGYVVKDAIHLLREKGEKVFVIDFNNDFGQYVSALGGTVIDFAKEDFYINPMTLSLDIPYEEEKMNKIGQKCEYLFALFSSFLGESLLARERSILYNAVKEVYKQCETPSFQDIYDFLSKDTTDAGRLFFLKIEASVGKNIKKYFHQTETNIENDFICFSLGNIGSNCKFVGIALLERLYRFIKENHSSQRITIVIPYLTSNIKQEDFSQYISSVTKVSKRYNCRLLFCDRSVGEFIQQYRNIVYNVPSFVLLTPSAMDREMIKNFYDLSQNDVDFLSSCGVGEGLYLSSKREVTIFKQLYKGEK